MDIIGRVICRGSEFELLDCLHSMLRAWDGVRDCKGRKITERSENISQQVAFVRVVGERFISANSELKGQRERESVSVCV